MEETRRGMADTPQEAIPSTGSGIDLKRICKDYGVRIIPYDAASEIMEKIGLAAPDAGGYAMSVGELRIIVYDPKRPAEEMRYTIAHELGHILLGHVSFRGSCKGIPQRLLEEEANIFASVLIANDIYSRYGTSSRVEKGINR